MCWTLREGQYLTPREGRCLPLDIASSHESRGWQWEEKFKKENIMQKMKKKILVNSLSPKESDGRNKVWEDGEGEMILDTIYTPALFRWTPWPPWSGRSTICTPTSCRLYAHLLLVTSGSETKFITPKHVVRECGRPFLCSYNLE